MKKTAFLIASLLLCFGFAQAQDVYFAGNHNGTGKIWKNNSLVYSLSDSLSVSPQALQVTPEGAVYSAGFVHDTAYSQGRVWLNDSLLFSAGENSVINSLFVIGNDWTAAGYGKNEWNLPQGLVWNNGAILHAFSDSLSPNYVYALCTDTVTGDIYAGGTTDSLEWAAVWKNDALLWDAELTSTVCCLHHDGTNLYAGGYYYLEGLLMATLWENGEVLYSFGDSLISVFQAIAVYDGDIYTSGYAEDSVFVWKNGEVLYAHPFDENGDLYTLCVNEFGVYYAGQIDNMGMVWKDSEILYAPEDCERITALVVVPSEPTTVFTLTVEANNALWGSVSGGGEYSFGDTATIAATANIGCEFLFWNDSITDNPRTVVVTQDSTFTAHFGQLEYFVETVVTPEGSGTVTGGGICHYGDTLTLEAVPNPGYGFIGWTDGITDNPRDVIVEQDSTFTAEFSSMQYTITVVSDHPAWGSVSGGGTFPYGTTIEIAATANLGFAFANWTDGNTDNPRTVVVTQDQTYTAHFEIRQCLIQTEAIPFDGGTINGGGTYDYGTTIHLSAHGNTGYVFSHWSDGAIENPRSVFVEGDATYTAVFEALMYEITTACDPVDGGKVSGGGTYPYGTSIGLEATANDHYIFLCWHDGIVSNPRTVTVTKDASFTALFYQNDTPQYTIELRSNDTLLGTVSGSGTYPEGSTIEISAWPKAGAMFTSWSDGNTDNPRNITVTQDLTLMGMFTKAPAYTIQVVSENPLMGSAYGGGIYNLNDVITIGAIPGIGFHFAGWQDGNMDNPRSIIVTGDATYTASFAKTPTPTYSITVYYNENQGFVLGAGDYVEGSIATLAAIPTDGYLFVKWSDEVTDNPRNITVTQNIVLAAFFDNTAVDEHEVQPISLYPNPANDRIRIEGLEDETEISIFNTLGMLLMTQTLDGNDEISVGDLASGLYIIRVGRRHAKFMKR